MSRVVELQGVTKRYGQLVALREASLSLDAGEAVALVGHNGAGKTTLLKLVLGLIRPEQGTVRVLGEDPAGRRGAQVRRRLSFLPESVAFHAAMTGTELLSFYARLKGASRRTNAALLERVGLTEAAHRRVGTYSKGMRQRLGLAQTLIGEPDLLLLDEPTSGLDPDSRALIYDTVDRRRAAGAAVLISTHALAEIERHVDRAIMLHGGAVLAVGRLQDLRQHVALPVRIRLSFRACSTETVLAALGPDVQVLSRDTQRLELAVPRPRKLDLLHALAAVRALLTDVQIEEPGLEDLYRSLVSGVGR